MRILDVTVDWIMRLLSWLPDQARSVLWLPVLAVVVVLVIRFLLRKGIPWLGNVAVASLRLLVNVVGAPLLLLSMLATAPFRAARLRPPGAVYTYDDAVISAVTGLQTVLRRGTGGFANLAKVHLVVILVLSGLVVWWWDRGHCSRTDHATACVSPIGQWSSAFGQLGE